MLPVGGGEFARDCEVEVNEMLSEIETCSLDGVPGNWIDATLGSRDGSLAAGGPASLGVETVVEGVSAFGVGTRRRVLGAAFTTGDTILPLGDSGFEFVEGVRATLRWVI